jgi:preprotein translocase subunit Sec63
MNDLGIIALVVVMVIAVVTGGSPNKKELREIRNALKNLDPSSPKVRVKEPMGTFKAIGWIIVAFVVLKMIGA